MNLYVNEMFLVNTSTPTNWITTTPLMLYALGETLPICYNIFTIMMLQISRYSATSEQFYMISTYEVQSFIKIFDALGSNIVEFRYLPLDMYLLLRMLPSSLKNSLSYCKRKCEINGQEIFKETFL